MLNVKCSNFQPKLYKKKIKKKSQQILKFIRYKIENLPLIQIFYHLKISLNSF